MRCMSVILLGLLLTGCGLSERDDFLVGRSCDPGAEMDCDEGQVCLPHGWLSARPTEFRCRDAASFSAPDEAPTAYCDEALGFACPEGVECRPGRIREDSGPRRPECVSTDFPFGPFPVEDAG